MKPPVWIILGGWLLGATLGFLAGFWGVFFYARLTTTPEAFGFLYGLIFVMLVAGVIGALVGCLVGMAGIHVLHASRWSKVSSHVGAAGYILLLLAVCVHLWLFRS